MDQTNTNTITPEQREKVFKDLALVLGDGLEKGQISVEQASEISQFVLGRLNIIQTKTELAAFLNELASKWSVYKSVSLQLQEDDAKNEKIEELKQDISQIHNQ